MRPMIVTMTVAALLSIGGAACSGTSSNQAVFGSTHPAPKGDYVSGMVVTGGTYDIEQPGMHNYSGHAVQLQSVQLISPRTAGIRILSIKAYPLSQVGTTAYVDEGNLPKGCPREFKPQPLSAVVVAPHSASRWDVIIALTFQKPGKYQFGKLKISYRTAGQSGSQVYYLEHLYLRTVSRKKYPHLYEPDVCS